MFDAAKTKSPLQASPIGRVLANLRTLATAVIVAGVGLTFLAGWLADRYQTASTQQQIELQSNNAIYAIRVALDRIAIAVQAIRALYGSNAVTQEKYDRFVRTLTSSESIRSLAFYRRLTNDVRDAYEQRFSTEPAGSLGVWVYSEDGRPIRSPEKAVYFVVEAGYFQNEDEPSYGLDISSLPGRAESIEEASRSGQLVATETVKLLNTTIPGVLLYVPVHDRSGNEIGVAAGSVSLMDLTTAARLASGVLDVAISVVNDAVTSPDADEEAAEHGRRVIDFGGKTWTVSVTPAISNNMLANWTMILIICAGLAATAALLAYLSTLSKTAELAVAQSRLSGTLDGLGPLAWLLTADGTIVSANRSAVAAFGESDSGAGRPFWGLPFEGITEDQSQKIRSAIAAAGRHEDVRFDLDIQGSEIRQVLDFWIRPLVSSEGKVENLVASAVDVTDRYEGEETQRLLMRELDHRMKNTLQVIQAIIRRTAKSHGSVDKFEQSLVGRVNAMSRAHELLAEERWLGADIGTIIRQELANFDADEAIQSSGPRVRLNPKAAVSFALAIHELGTNASKYGALSAPGGQITVSWAIERDGNEPRFELRWRETGGPPVDAPTQQGFGSMLIERSIAYELDGSAHIDYEREGVLCTISAPLRAIRPFVTGTPVSASA